MCPQGSLALALQYYQWAFDIRTKVRLSLSVSGPCYIYISIYLYTCYICA